MTASYQLQLFTVDARHKREALPKQNTQKLHPPEDFMNTLRHKREALPNQNTRKLHPPEDFMNTKDIKEKSFQNKILKHSIP